MTSLTTLALTAPLFASQPGWHVFLAETDNQGVVAIWKPGAAQLEVRPVRLPQRTSGSDSFAPLP